jgi:predicted acyltransferase
MRGPKSIKEKTLGLAAGAVVCLGTGYLWSIWFPLNKKMWTSSFVIAAAGWSLTVFALAFWAVEIKGWGKSKGGSKFDVLTRAAVWPWLVFGSNAIAAYMVSELLPGISDFAHFTSDGHDMSPLWWARLHFFGFLPNDGWAPFAYSVSFTALCFIPVWIMYRKKIFLKV